MGYRRSKSSNAIETPKKNVTFMKNRNKLSDNDQCHDGFNIEKQKSKGQGKTKSNIHKTVSYEPSKLSVAQKRNVGSSLKKKSFSLMSLVTKKYHDVAITPSEGNSKVRKHDLEGRNEIEENRTTTIIQSNEIPKTYLTKVVSPSQPSINPTKNVNGANIQTSSSTHLVPSLSSKVLRL